MNEYNTDNGSMDSLAQRVRSREQLEDIFRTLALKNGGKARVREMAVPNRAIILAHIIGTSTDPVYTNLAINIGFHDEDDPTGRAIGVLRMNPWETVVIGADVATKAASIDIGFMDRFSGALIITGEREDVVTAVTAVVDFFRDEMHYDCCPVTWR